MSGALRGLDAWITRSGLDDTGPECRDCGYAFLLHDNVPADLICDECRVSQCDVCGELKAGCTSMTVFGNRDVTACPKCRYKEEGP